MLDRAARAPLAIAALEPVRRARRRRAARRQNEPRSRLKADVTLPTSLYLGQSYLLSPSWGLGRRRRPPTVDHRDRRRRNHRRPPPPSIHQRLPERPHGRLTRPCASTARKGTCRTRDSADKSDGSPAPIVRERASHQAWSNHQVCLTADCPTARLPAGIPGAAGGKREAPGSWAGGLFEGPRRPELCSIARNGSGSLVP